MSDPSPVEPVPEETARMARAAFPKGDDYLRMRDEMGAIFDDEHFAHLDAVGAPGAPAWLREVPALETLRRVWVQQYLSTPSGWRFRSKEDGLPSAAISVETPFDPDARYSRRYDEPWVGYLVHLTETCGEDGPNVVTHVETVPAPTTTRRRRRWCTRRSTPGICCRKRISSTLTTCIRGCSSRLATVTVWTSWPLARQLRVAGARGDGLRPGELRDRLGREGRGLPPRAREDDLAAPGEARATHPRDSTLQVGLRLLPEQGPVHPLGGHGRPKRELMIPSREHYEALRLAREREETPRYAEEYAGRRGIEGTISRAVRSCVLRRSRYRDLGKTRLRHLLTAAAPNFVRTGEWIDGRPRAGLRSSPFARPLAGMAHG